MAKKDKLNIDDYTLVTDINRKFSLRYGRKLHVIEKVKDEYQKVNQDSASKNYDFFIRPKLEKGWFYWGKDKCFVTQDEPYSEYLQHKEVIDHFIKEQKLYINASQKLIELKKHE